MVADMFVDRCFTGVDTWIALMQARMKPWEGTGDGSMNESRDPYRLGGFISNFQLYGICGVFDHGPGQTLMNSERVYRNY